MPPRESSTITADGVRRSPSSDPHAPGRDELAALAADAGIRRVHMLAWRDLADVEAGGSELHMAKVAALFAEAGLEVTIRTSYAQGQATDDRRDGYRVIRKAGRHTVFPHAIASELLGRHGRCDAMIEAWNGVPFLTPLWFRGPRVTLLHHVHRDMWDLVLPSRLARVGQYLESELAPPFYRTTPIVALCRSAREEIISQLGLPADHITVAEPGIDPLFCPSDDEPKTTHPTVLAVGRLMPPKRFDVLIRLAAEVHRQIPDLELVIAGEGADRTRLEGIVRELDAGDWVRLPGRVSNDELLALYRRSWVVAATSMAEGWGMTLTEAAACGTPAVATRIPGHSDSVDDGTSGLLGDDERELVAHLLAVLGDAELRARLSEGARKHAAALTWDATAWGVFAPLADQALARRARAGR